MLHLRTAGMRFENYTLKMPKVSQRSSTDRIEIGDDIDGIRLISRKSPVMDRRAAYTLACYFRREFGYDCVQYAIDEDYPRDRVVLLLSRYGDQPRFAFGAICMRWREYIDHPAGFAMAWAWMHPYERNHGHLKTLWPMLEERFGSFAVETPLSPAMNHFLEKRDELWRRSGVISS